MEKKDFLTLLHLYKQKPSATNKQKILSCATKNPTWLIFPTSNKFIWELCTELLIELPYNVVKKNLVAILKYYQDINWPGVDRITNYLITIPKGDLIEAVLEALILAKDDDFWLFGLVSLSVKADILDTFNSVEKYKTLILKSEYFE